MCTTVDNCAQIAESGLKPPSESPHVDFLELNRGGGGPNGGCPTFFFDFDRN